MNASRFTTPSAIVLALAAAGVLGAAATGAYTSANALGVSTPTVITAPAASVAPQITLPDFSTITARDGPQRGMGDSHGEIQPRARGTRVHRTEVLGGTFADYRCQHFGDVQHVGRVTFSFVLWPSGASQSTLCLGSSIGTQFWTVPVQRPNCDKL